jgi:hypothetical protein
VPQSFLAPRAASGSRPGCCSPRLPARWRRPGLCGNAAGRRTSAWACSASRWPGTPCRASPSRPYLDASPAEALSTIKEGTDKKPFRTIAEIETIVARGGLGDDDAVWCVHLALNEQALQTGAEAENRRLADERFGVLSLGVQVRGAIGVRTDRRSRGQTSSVFEAGASGALALNSRDPITLWAPYPRSLHPLLVPVGPPSPRRSIPNS